MEAFDPIQLNAAIDALVESKGYASDARGIVYDFGLTLPPMSRVAGSLHLKSPGDSVTGYAAEHGNVQVDDGKNDVKRVDFGGERTRIGSYKIWREKERSGTFAIALAHFWKLDEGTESETEEACVWRLTCDRNGPMWFGERATAVVFRFLGFSLKREYFVESWGEHSDERHPAGWRIELTV